MAKFTAACVQLNSGNDLAKNIESVIELVTHAAAKGAEFITLPENAFFMGASREESIEQAKAPEYHPAVKAMQQLAAGLKIWILFGIAVPSTIDGKLYNRSMLIDNKGAIAAAYDKIHLFDVTIKGGESHKESDTFTPGDKAVIASLPWAKLGMTICYDLRFPQLFRALSQGGASIITVPSAFTHKTGSAHWHSLLRARAIESQCYIIAPAQAGHHPRGRQTFGHSIIINPWGEILAEGSEGETGVITAEIDLDLLAEIRESLPSLKHDRKFTLNS